MCANLRVRKEWRSLSREEKHDYIDALKCLHETPSALGLNQSRYHDFAWIHYHVGGNSHKAAPFLAWHRLFLHNVHQVLRDECHYTGEMTYWDWSLDWEDFTKAPIWDAETGFGGDGDPHQGEDILGGHCVVDGPFANTSVPLLKDEAHPHCLSRGFADVEERRKYARFYNPDALHKLLQKDNYNDLNLGMEFSAHNSIPTSIKGDFLLLTAPFDPVFFLHHAQLDRLWWKWQHMTPGRLRQYNGETEANSSIAASLSDALHMGGLGLDATVGDIIETESEFLCYEY